MSGFGSDKGLFLIFIYKNDIFRHYSQCFSRFFAVETGFITLIVCLVCVDCMVNVCCDLVALKRNLFVALIEFHFLPLE